mmetsp:Transcript_28849/g.73590  ORF Transcript_28849/g.73590 Transcript_28849/m.73590 type:complete len:129 (+) Transcript_28849:134-520(+)
MQLNIASSTSRAVVLRFLVQPGMAAWAAPGAKQCPILFLPSNLETQHDAPTPCQERITSCTKHTREQDASLSRAHRSLYLPLSGRPHPSATHPLTMTLNTQLLQPQGLRTSSDSPPALLRAPLMSLST